MRSIFKERPRLSYPKVGRWHVRIESYPDSSLTRTLAARLVSFCREHWSTALIVLFVLGFSAAVFVAAEALL